MIENEGLWRNFSEFSFQKQAFVIVTIASIAHFSFYWVVPPIVWPDSIRYATLSSDFFEKLATGKWDLWTSPGYPFFLWLSRHWIATAEGVALVQQFLAVMTCFFVWISVRRLWGEQEALIAGIVVALSPIRHYYAQAFLSESLAEWYFSGGICFLILSTDQLIRRMVAFRVMAGLFLGAATLFRVNLAPALFLACLLPIKYQNIKYWSKQSTVGVLSICIAWFLIVLPWITFNVNRGVYGLNGNLGYQLHAFANDHGIGEPFQYAWIRGSLKVKIGLREWVNFTPQVDREMQHSAWKRFATHRVAYLRAVLSSARALFAPIYSIGDVAPMIPSCRGIPLGQDLNGFRQKPLSSIPIAQVTIQAILCSLYNILISLGWMVVMIWWLTSVITPRFDHSILAAIPLICVGSLCVIIQQNTRYAFPCEAFTLAFGTAFCVSFFKNRLHKVRLKNPPG